MTFSSCSFREHQLSRTNCSCIYQLVSVSNVVLWGICWWFVYFSVSTLTVFQSWFLRDGNVVVFSDKIHFIIFTFVLSSYVMFYSVVLMFWLLLIYVSIRLGGCFFFFGIWPIGHCIRVLLTCFPIFLLAYFLYFKVFIIVLAWSVRLWLIILNLKHSSQISIILFL